MISLDEEKEAPFKWEYIVSDTNFLSIKEKLIAIFLPQKILPLSLDNSIQEMFQTFVILGWGYNSRKELQVSVCSRSKPSSKLHGSNLQVYSNLQNRNQYIFHPPVKSHLDMCTKAQMGYILKSAPAVIDF